MAADNKAGDYVALPRSALTDDMWQNAYAARLYFYLLRKADGNGEWKVSLKEIRADLGLTRQQYRTALDVLETTSIATAKGTAKTTSISLCGIDNKRISKTAKTTSIATAKGTAKFTPPTDAEVTAYVAEKGYHFNPAQFVPHYQSKGWKVGNQPMKDWRAACRTWENSWKEKHGTKFYYETQPIAIQRGAFAAQTDRYSELERAAGAILRNAPYYDPAKND